MRTATAALLCVLALNALGQLPAARLAEPVVAGPEMAVLPLADYFPETVPGTKFKVSGHGGYPGALGDTTMPIAVFQPLHPLAVARLEANGEFTEVLIIASTLRPVEWLIPMKEETGAVRIFGSFNAWNRNADTLAYDEEAGGYQVKLNLKPGRYEYKLMAGAEERLDPSNKEKVSNGMGGFNSLLEVQEGEGPAPVALLPVWEEGMLKLPNLPEDQEVFAFWDNRLLETERMKGSCHIRLPEEAASVQRSHLRVYSYRGHRLSNDVLIPLEKGQPVTHTSSLQRSDWRSAVLYFLMVDRFKNGNPGNDRLTPGDDILPKANYMGGDLAGVQQALEAGYFDQLGVNTLWLSPITQNPLDAWGLWDKGGVKTRFSGYHGYWPITSTTVDFRFGSDKELHQLLDNAHARNMNMLLDYVANHVHRDHLVYKLHPDWATPLYLPDGSMNTERWDEHRLTTWFDTFMPTLELRNPEVVEPMTDSALVWVTEYDFDGFRHDATKHIDELFWRTLTAKVKTRVPERSIYQIGETYGSPELIRSYISNGMLDAQFDFNLYDAAVEAFAQDKPNYGKLTDVLQQSLETYGYHHQMGNITGNQDRTRFISLAGGAVKFDEDQKLAGYTREIGVGEANAYDKLLLLHAFNLLVPGIPCIYYGDEFGLPGAHDPDNRRMMKFSGLTPAEQQLKDRVTYLIQLRRNSMSLLYGHTEVELVGEHLLHIKRTYLGQTVEGWFNNSDKTILLDLPDKRGEQLFISKPAKIAGTLPAHSVMIRSYTTLP